MLKQNLIRKNANDFANGTLKQVQDDGKGIVFRLTSQKK